MSAQSFQEETANDLEAVRDKFVGLASTMPDGAMTWRPGEGVRSVIGEFIAYTYAKFFFHP